MTAEPVRVIESKGTKPVRALEVRKVDRDGPAAHAGIEAGDIILRVNGEPGEDFAHWTVSRVDRERLKPALLEGYRGSDCKVWKMQLGPVQHGSFSMGFLGLWWPPLFSVGSEQFTVPGTFLWLGYGHDSTGFWLWPLGGYSHIADTRTYYITFLLIVNYTRYR